MNILIAALAIGLASATFAPVSTALAAEDSGHINDSTAKLPDWSGVWNPHLSGGLMFDPTTMQRPENRNQGSGANMREWPPYNAEWEAKYEAKLARNKAGLPTDPTASCRPGGMPRIMTTPYPMEFLIQKDRVTVLLEISSQVRRIYTDGRKHPAPDDLDPSYMGHSIGHWEGDTLVVDTVGLNDETWLGGDIGGRAVYTSIHSDKEHE